MKNGVKRGSIVSRETSGRFADGDAGADVDSSW